MTTPFIATFSVENAHKSDIYCLAACRRFTIAGSGDGHISLWDNQKPNDDLRTLNDEVISAGIHHLAVDAAGNWCIAISFDGSVLCWDLENQVPRNLESIGSVIKGAWGCAIAGDLAAICTLRGSIIVIDLAGDKVVAELNEPQSSESKKTPCFCVDISSDGKYVAGGYDMGITRVYSVDSGYIAYTLPSRITRPRCIRFNHQVSMVAVTGNESVALFTLSGGSYLGSLLGHDSFIYDLSFNDTGDKLLSVSGDGKAKVWSLDTREVKFTASDSNVPLFAGCWVPERTPIIGGAPGGFATAGIDKCIRWYREASGSDL